MALTTVASDSKEAVVLLVAGLFCLASVLLLLHPVMATANANKATFGRAGEEVKKGLVNRLVIDIIS